MMFARPANEIRYGAASCDGLGSPSEIGVFSSSNAPLITGVSPVCANGEFTGSIPCSPGLWYRRGVREAGGSFSIEANNFGIGEVIPIIGQSNASRMFGGSAPTPAPSYVRQFQHNAAQGNVETWEPPQGVGVCAMANQIASSKPNVPLGILNLALDSTLIEQWVNEQSQSLSQPWPRFTAYMAGRDFRFAVFIQGEGDAGVGTSYSDYKTMLGMLHRKLLAFTGRTASSFNFVIVQIGAVTPNAYSGVTQARIDAIKQAQYDYATTTPGAAYGGSLWGLATVDGTHLSYASNGTGALGVSLGLTVARLM